MAGTSGGRCTNRVHTNYIMRYSQDASEKYTLPPSISLSLSQTGEAHTHTHTRYTHTIRQSCFYAANRQLGRRACLRLGLDFTNQAIAPELHSLHSRLSFLSDPHTPSAASHSFLRTPRQHLPGHFC